MSFFYISYSSIFSVLPILPPGRGLFLSGRIPFFIQYSFITEESHFFSSLSLKVSFLPVMDCWSRNAESRQIPLIPESLRVPFPVISCVGRKDLYWWQWGNVVVVPQAGCANVYKASCSVASQLTQLPHVFAFSRCFAPLHAHTC